MLRGLEDLIDAVRPQPGIMSARGSARGKRGEASRRFSFGNRALTNDPSSSSSGAKAAEQSFPDAWKAYRASNPRLRDPKTLPLLIRRDSPNELRREVWSHCLGVDAGEISGCLPETEVSKLPEGIDALIEADLARTFPNSKEFQDVGGQDSLRRILRNLAVVDSDLGYCQSLNFLAAVLLMVFLNEEAAVLGVQTLLVKLGIRTWYCDGMRQLRADTSVLEELLKERLPGVMNVFKAHDFELLYLASKWFLALFSTTLDGDTLRRVWDVMLCDGIEAVFRVAFALLNRHAEEVMRADSIDDLMILFHGMQTGWTPEALLKAAYDPAVMGQIGRAELAQRRKAAMDRISSADVRAEIRTSIIWRGGVQPVSAMARMAKESS